jgi:membrane-bound lytic murein transglycosylase D
LVIYADNGGYSITASANSSKSNARVAPFGAYKVRKGDSLSSIAQKFNCTQSELKSLNKIENNVLKVGEFIRIPLKE